MSETERIELINEMKSIVGEEKAEAFLATNPSTETLKVAVACIQRL